MDNINETLFIDFFKSEVGKKYVDQVVNGSDFIVINLDEMKTWNAQNTLIVINDATKYGIRLVEKALKNAVQESKPIGNIQSFDVGFKGQTIPYVKIHDLASNDIGKLVRVKGLVSRTHFIKPMAKKVSFICQSCASKDYEDALNNMEVIFQKIPFILTAPKKKCERCDDTTNWVSLDEFSTFIDSQEFYLQEGHEDSCGRTPQIIQMIVTKKHLINKVYCGNSIEVIGVVRLLPSYRNKAKSRFYIPYVEVYDIIKDSKDPEDMEISSEEEQQIIALSQEPNIYLKIVENIAPSIVGMTKVKEGALLTIIGGVSEDKGDIKIRGNIHVLVVGDGGMGKSQILLSATDLAPKGVSSVGRGVSGAGLTAAMTHDEATGDWVVEAGILVLADNGLATVDEIDKMTDNDRMHIHEAMEQQTVTIHKAGRHVMLRARTAVLAAANPHLGRFNPDESLFKQVKFPPTLFSRFDLIFLCIDKADRETDRLVTNKILGSTEIVQPTIDRVLLKKYLAYAKTIVPVMSTDAEKYIGDYFLKVREHLYATKADINEKSNEAPITFRQVEGLRRIAEAHAKVLLKTVVDIEDAKYAEEIFNKYLKDIQFDIQAQNSDIAKDDRTVIQKVQVYLGNLQGLYPNGVPFTVLANELRSKGIKNPEKTIVQLENNVEIMQVGYEGQEKLYKTR